MFYHVFAVLFYIIKLITCCIDLLFVCFNSFFDVIMIVLPFSFCFGNYHDDLAQFMGGVFVMDWLMPSKKNPAVTVVTIVSVCCAVVSNLTTHIYISVLEMTCRFLLFLARH